jgi:hypothetical protein
LEIDITETSFITERDGDMGPDIIGYHALTAGSEGVGVGRVSEDESEASVGNEAEPPSAVAVGEEGAVGAGGRFYPSGESDGGGG